MLFPEAAREVAIAAWRIRHPYQAWPLDPPRSFGGGATNLADVAEADALMDAATLGSLSQFADFQNEANRTALYSDTGPVTRRTAYVGVLVGDGRPPSDLWWKADWSDYRTHTTISADILRATPAVSATRESFADWAARLPSTQPINPYGILAAAAPISASSRQSLTMTAGFFGGSGGPNWDNIGEMSALVIRYLSGLTPRQELANLTAIKNIAIKEKWSKADIAYWTRLVGKKAMDYKHYFEDDPQ